jgi:hypothetical protein
MAAINKCTVSDPFIRLHITTNAFHFLSLHQNRSKATKYEEHDEDHHHLQTLTESDYHKILQSSPKFNSTESEASQKHQISFQFHKYNSNLQKKEKAL